MLNLMQLLRMLDETQRYDFILIFGDFEYQIELNDSWGDAKYILFNDLLIDAFGLEIYCPKQLKRIVDAMMRGNLSSIVELSNQLVA